MEEIKKGEGEYKNCARCSKRFRRKKSMWNAFKSYDFCKRCSDSFNKWWEDNNSSSKAKESQ